MQRETRNKCKKAQEITLVVCDFLRVSTRENAVSWRLKLDLLEDNLRFLWLTQKTMRISEKIVQKTTLIM